MGRLILVRHGNTFDAGDVVTRVGARTDLPLSGSGTQQAEALAEIFATTPFIAAFASPLQRTRQTARLILLRQHDAPALRLLPFLTEIDYGPDENQTEDKVLARLGAAALADWDARALPPPGWQVDPAALIMAWRDLATRIASIDAAVLIVTSNGIARFLPDALHLAPGAVDLKLKTGAYCDLTLQPGGAHISAWNVRPASIG